MGRDMDMHYMLALCAPFLLQSLQLSIFSDENCVRFVNTKCTSGFKANSSSLWPQMNAHGQVLWKFPFRAAPSVLPGCTTRDRQTVLDSLPEEAKLSIFSPWFTLWSMSKQ